MLFLAVQPQRTAQIITVNLTIPPKSLYRVAANACSVDLLEPNVAHSSSRGVPKTQEVLSASLQMHHSACCR